MLVCTFYTKVKIGKTQKLKIPSHIPLSVKYLSLNVDYFLAPLGAGLCTRIAHIVTMYLLLEW